jgi:hypothetical protein
LYSNHDYDYQGIFKTRVQKKSGIVVR